MLNKTVSKDRALEHIRSGQTIMFGDWHGEFAADELIDAMLAKGITDIDAIAVSAGMPDQGLGKLIAAKRVKSLVTTHIGLNPVAKDQMLSGELAVEFVPQGTWAERVRCGGSGIGGFLTPTGLGTEVEKGKEKITVGGDRITDVKGNDVLTAENITHTARTQLINNVGTTSMTMTATNTTFNNDVVMNNNLDVTGDVRAASYKIGSKTYIDNNGINANDQKIINVADGTLSDTSMDAVNGSQLFRTNQRIERWNRDLSRVGAGAAALAGLHPVDYDATSKLSFAVGFGSYKSEHAAAIGAFYRPNDNILFGVSSTVGYGDNMYNASLSFKFGEGSHERGISKAAQRKIDTLQNKVSLLEARLDNILNIFNPNAYKDFPDIPENHWAYEAVSTLAGNGIVEGYPDGDYHGDRTMTRYEMAMIIYNALKRGVQADMKLVREFQPELSMIEANTQ